MNPQRFRQIDGSPTLLMSGYYVVTDEGKTSGPWRTHAAALAAKEGRFIDAEGLEKYSDKFAGVPIDDYPPDLQGFIYDLIAGKDVSAKHRQEVREFGRDYRKRNP